MPDLDQRTTLPDQWAPWWVYVLVLAPANLGKEQLLPDESAWWVRAGLTAAILAVGIAVITAAYRAAARANGRERRW